jgi:putative hemolysin
MGWDISLVLVLILGNGLFAGAEIAVLTLRRSRLAQLVGEHRRGAASVEALRHQPERFLATIQIGITVVGATSAAYGGTNIAARLAAGFQALGLDPEPADEVAFVIVVAAISYLTLVLGELVPKSLALKHAERFALIAGRPLRLLSRAARPLVWLLTASSNAILRWFGDRTTFTEARLSREEVQDVITEAARSGTVAHPLGEIASRALRLGELPVSAVMVPRTEMVAVSATAMFPELKDLLLEAGHSRMPVYGTGHDDLFGYVMAKDVLSMIWAEGLVVLADIVRPLVALPATTPIIEALRELQRRRTQLAVVRDADGGVAGIVTVEDMVEELVGEIATEDEPQAIRRLEDGSALVRGTAPLREVNRELGLALPEEGGTTLAGLAIARTGWLPAPGTVVTLEDGTTLEVVEATSRRVNLVRVRRRGAAPPGRPATR